MEKIRLDSRLESVASLVEKGSVVADIGTDHAYLLCYLIQKGICPSGIAADLRKGPLANAQQTVVSCGLSDKVELVLSDGLQNIKENSCDTIVMAGMGGILISEIIQKAPWVFSEGVSIIAQPMTHAEVLRKFLCENGFEIKKEVTSTDGKRVYCALNAQYTGNKANKDESYYFLGELTSNNDEITRKYIDKLIFTLDKKLQAQEKAGVSESQELARILNDIKLKVEQVNL